MNYSDFSSWPRDQEQSFVVYEQRANDSSRKAILGGIVAAVAVFIIALGIYAGVEPDKRDLGKDMNMSNLTKKEKKAAPAPAPSAAPAAEQKAPEAPAGDQKAPEAPAPAPEQK